MNRYTEELKQKLAWQAAFELRTCPPDEILLAEHVDQNLQKHLSICHLCRQQRELSKADLHAWEILKNRFADNTVRPATGTARQPGQVWTISSTAGGWNAEGRYLQPPTVLLLAQNDRSATWLVSQLYPDKRLMAQRDVELGEIFGFAQGWNCYQITDSILDKCIGRVTQEQLDKVLKLSETSSDEVPANNPVLVFFRELERGVGNNLTRQVDIQEVLHPNYISIFPGLSSFVTNAKDFALEATLDALDVLTRSFKPALVLRSSDTRKAGRVLSNEEKESLGEACPVIPVGLTVLENSMVLSLKWLQLKPEALPEIVVNLNLPEQVKVEIVSATPEKVIIRHSLILVDQLEIRSICISGGECTLTISINADSNQDQG